MDSEVELYQNDRAINVLK